MPTEFIIKTHDEQGTETFHVTADTKADARKIVTDSSGHNGMEIVSVKAVK